MIYVVGSLNMDISAQLKRFPKEGETIAAESVLVSPGGKGANQAAAIGKLGGQCAMVGKVGNDAYGENLRAHLAAYHVDVRGVTVADGKSGTAMIWVHGGNNRIVIDAGANGLLSCADVDKGLENAKAGDILILQLEVPLAVAKHALKTGARKGMLTVLNPAPAVPLSSAIYENAELLTPNETETQILTGILPDCEVNIALAVKKLRGMGARNVIITLGSAGSAVAIGQEITLVPAHKVNIIDTTAAGDTYMGALAVKLAAGDDLIAAAKFATAASALKITRKGAAVAIPTLQEVEEYIARGGFAAS
ncbi:MAG: ribokinase [Clostridiales bacterium]|nr:ribokinase [Clostridiales bacterium]